MDQALLLADRLGAELKPLTERTCVALLPVAGKPLIEHALEALARAGVQRVIVVVSPFADEVQRVIGDGARWGLRLTYTLSRGEEDPTAVAARLGTRLDEAFVALRGDLVLGFDLAAWLAQAEALAALRVWAQTGATSAGCGIHRAAEHDLRPLAWPSPSGREASQGIAWLPVEPSLCRPADSLADYHRANLDAAAGRLPGLILPGREVALGLTVGRGSKVSPRALKQGICFVGARCRVAPDAELHGEVVIGDDVIVDRAATLRDCVILPHTYVGELVEIADAIVCGNTMIRIDTGAVLPVTDAFLLADLQQATLSQGIAEPLHRLLGLFTLVLSLPLWPVAALASLGNRKAGGWLIRQQRRGNRRTLDGDGQSRRCDFTAWDWNTPVPILRRLPWLLAVVRGDLRLVGVVPLPPEEADGLIEEWERSREEAPAGLIGPTQLQIPADAPREERLMSDVFYARQRSLRRDLLYLLLGLAAVFQARSWRAVSRR